MEESAVVLIIKENSPLFHPPVVHMVKGVFDVDLNSIPSWHLACKYTTGSDLVKWWRRWDLNPQPPQCECGALPLSYVPLVEMMGIEPTTPSMPWKCSTVELRPQAQSEQWWRRWESNPQPPQCECGALPLSYVPPLVEPGRIALPH